VIQWASIIRHFCLAKTTQISLQLATDSIDAMVSVSQFAVGGDWLMGWATTPEH